MPHLRNGNNPSSRIQEAAENVVDQTQQAAAAVGNKAEGAMHSVGERLQNFAEVVRNKAPQEGIVGEAASGIADTMKSSGQYLQNKTMKDLADDATECVRRHPVAAMLVGLGLGFLLAQATRRS